VNNQGKEWRCENNNERSIEFDEFNRELVAASKQTHESNSHSGVHAQCTTVVESVNGMWLSKEAGYVVISKTSNSFTLKYDEPVNNLSFATPLLFV
jgi:hypothetical protein